MDNCKQSDWYLMAMEDSTDVTDTAQLLICIGGDNDEFNITQLSTGVNTRHYNRRVFVC